MTPIDLATALEKVISAAHPLPVECVELASAAGHILAEDQTADRDFPPYDRVTMDGIAIRLGNIGNKPAESYHIHAVQAAGAPRIELRDEANCIEVMTGSILPAGTDTVVPYELLEIEAGRARLTVDSISRRNIHRQGSDRKKGQGVLKKGKRIHAGDIAVLATIGAARIPVFAMPKVAIISTGDELVEVQETPQPHQIRKSNGPMLRAALQCDGIAADSFHIKDERDEVRDRLQRLLREYDVLLLSGGVSKGKYDLLPEVFEELGVRKDFHRVAQKPGKPFWFGVQGDGERQVFAFPGNPVSTLVCYLYYFRQWLQASCGIESDLPLKKLSEPVRKDVHRAQFVPVRIDGRDSRARPLTYGGSGDLLVLAEAEGFVVVPAGEGMEEDKGSFEYIAI